MGKKKSIFNPSRNNLSSKQYAEWYTDPEKYEKKMQLIKEAMKKYNGRSK